MTNEEVGSLLGAFTAAFPGTRTSAEMVATWQESVGLYESSVVGSAARVWIETEDRWPTLHQFIDAIEAQVRLAADARALPAALPESIPTDPARATRAFRFLAEMNRAAQAGVPLSVEEVREQVRVRDLAVDAEQADRPMYSCFECLDSGFVEVPAQQGRLVPCGRCRVATRAMFDNGHYRSGHSCEICRPARGRRSA